jgi:hypothetical protein
MTLEEFAKSMHAHTVELMTWEQVETKDNLHTVNHDGSLSPLKRGSPAWRAFKAQWMHGDQVWLCSSIEFLSGCEEVVIVRDGQVVANYLWAVS